MWPGTAQLIELAFLHKSTASTAPAPHQPGGRGRAPAPEEHATIRETGRAPGLSQPVVQRPHEEPPTAQCEPRSSSSEASTSFLRETLGIDFTATAFCFFST